ncbi:MAG: L,D-transpeptidase [Candidatus Delongbacteria bacterium]|nr:L,D-transpeptidase [Candidatus Delongbacteria bacterium]MDD4204598.1 L,D-transpeptidase [Candidatus Delongbacteria bacterium]
MKIMIITEEQRLIFVHGNFHVEFPVSTSKYGEGYREGSGKTPLGEFEVCEKIGSGQPKGMIFRDRMPTGEIAELEEGGKDMITSRILRLKGLQKRNSNTLDRYIYIHGTGDEGSIGTKASIGCVRMNNDDIIELFDMVDKGCRVYIRKKLSQSQRLKIIS